MVKITNTAEACDRSGAKTVIFGKPKVGKTRLAATAPSPIILSSERGLLSLRSLKLPVIKIENEKVLDEAFAWLQSSAESRKFHTVIWDSASDTAEDILAVEQRGTTNKKDKWAPYNALAERMTGKLRDARNMEGRNWCIIAQEEFVKMPDGGMMAVPSLPGKALLQNLPYLFDGIFQMNLYVDPATGQEHRALKTRGDNITMGGDRSGNLDQWEPPHLGNIFAKMLS